MNSAFEEGTYSPCHVQDSLNGQFQTPYLGGMRQNE